MSCQSFYGSLFQHIGQTTFFSFLFKLNRDKYLSRFYLLLVVPDDVADEHIKVLYVVCCRVRTISPAMMNDVTASASFRGAC